MRDVDLSYTGVLKFLHAAQHEVFIFNPFIILNIFFECFRHVFFLKSF